MRTSGHFGIQLLLCFAGISFSISPKRLVLDNLISKRVRGLRGGAISSHLTNSLPLKEEIEDARKSAEQLRTRQLTAAERILLFPEHPPTHSEDGEHICGVGLCLSDDYPFIVSSVTPGSSAERSGNVFPGDEVIAINGQVLKGLSEAQIRELALGRAGTRVTLQIEPSKSLVGNDRGLHPASKTITIELVRGPSFLPSWAQAEEQDVPQSEEDKWKRAEKRYLEFAALGINTSDIGKWKVRFDEKSKRTYYVDTFNNRSQWRKPDAIVWSERLANTPLPKLAGECLEDAVRCLERRRRLLNTSAPDAALLSPEIRPIVERITGSSIQVDGADYSTSSDALASLNPRSAPHLKPYAVDNGTDTAGGKLAREAAGEEDMRRTVGEMREELEGRLLAAGINFSAIPDDGLHDIYTCSELEGDGEDVPGDFEEKLSAPLTAAEEAYLAAHPDFLDKLFFAPTAALLLDPLLPSPAAARSGTLPPGLAVAPSAAGTLPGTRAVAERVAAAVENLTAEVAATGDADAAEEAAAAGAVMTRVWGEAGRYGLDLEELLARTGVSPLDLLKARARVIGPLPEGASEGYAELRFVRGLMRRMEAAGGAWADPLTHGQDPMYDRIDFRVVPAPPTSREPARVLYLGDARLRLG